MLLIPDAVVDDGLLDVVTLRPHSRFGWARIGTRLTLQRLVHRSPAARDLLRLAPDLTALAYTQGTQFDVRLRAPQAIELDGDGFGHVIGARITVRPKALSVCVGDA